MRFLGILTAIVVGLCVFIFVSRYSSNETSSNSSSNSQDTGSTVNAVRETIRNVSGAEQRRKWVVRLQMKVNGTSDEAGYSVEGPNSDVLAIRSDTMDLAWCLNFAKSENGLAAAGVGFASVSCRSTSNGVILERPLTSGD